MLTAQVVCDNTGDNYRLISADGAHLLTFTDHGGGCVFLQLTMGEVYHLDHDAISALHSFFLMASCPPDEAAAASADVLPFQRTLRH
jgi:hypothetical protein